jgi:hypothetical protein
METCLCQKSPKNSSTLMHICHLPFLLLLDVEITATNNNETATAEGDNSTSSIMSHNAVMFMVSVN